MGRWLDWGASMMPLRFANRRKLLRSWKPAILFGILTLYLLYKLVSNGDTRPTLQKGIDINRLEPFEPDVTSQFPHGGTNKTLIPKIIHQTWRDTQIPPKFVGNIVTFAKNNPSWDYYFWTDENSRRLVHDHYPSLLPVWDNYVYSTHHRLRRFNVIRYVIMYVYGGVFADLDTVNHLPLDDVITGHSCIVSPEPFAHVLVNDAPFTISNSIILCQPRHPFFKFVLDNVHRYEHLSHSYDSAGPGFFTSVFISYHRTVRSVDEHTVLTHNVAAVKDYTNEPFFYRDYLASDKVVTDKVYVSNSHYLTGDGDKNQLGRLRSMCVKLQGVHPLHQRGCIHVRRQDTNKYKQFMYIEHLWQNNWYGWVNFYNYISFYTYIFGTNIRHIVPNCFIY